MSKKHTIQVRDKRTGEKVETIHRVLRAEQIGNFQPMFCNYKGDKRCLVKSDEGDLSDPFRREESYAQSFYIEVEVPSFTVEQMGGTFMLDVLTGRAG